MEEESRKKNSFEYSAEIDTAQAAGYLEALAARLREGRVERAAGGESIQIEAPGHVKIGVSAEVKAEKGKGEIEVSLSWKQPETAPAPMRIGAGGSPPAME